MTHQILQEAARTRRSVYALNKNLPLPAEEVAAIVEHAVLHTPSSFNSQSIVRKIARRMFFWLIKLWKQKHSMLKYDRNIMKKLKE